MESDSPMLTSLPIELYYALIIFLYGSLAVFLSAGSISAESIIRWFQGPHACYPIIFRIAARHTVVVACSLGLALVNILAYFFINRRCKRRVNGNGRIVHMRLIVIQLLVICPVIWWLVFSWCSAFL